MGVFLASWRRCAVFVIALVGSTQAAEAEAVVGHSVAAILVPGARGAEVCGKGHQSGHIDFRVDFGADLKLSVNGGPGVGFDPDATHLVRIECESVGGAWFATTRIRDLGAGGALVYEQVAQPIAGPGEEVGVAAAAVLLLDVG